MHHKILTSSYHEDLDSFVKDLIKYDDLIDKWKINHPGYDAFIESDIDAGIYTITVICKKQLKE